MGLGLWPHPILAVLGIFFIQLFPNWTACSPITYTYTHPLIKMMIWPQATTNKTGEVFLSQN